MTSPVENPLDEIRLFVNSARLEEAVTRLAQIEGFQHDASQLQSRLNFISDQDRKGVLTREQFYADRNKISDDLLGLIEIAATPVEGMPDALQPSYAHLRPVLKEPPFILPQLDITSFTGRHDELHQLESAIFNSVQPEAGIAGLTGAGGIGKSVLAFHFATVNRDRFPDGVIGLRVDEDDPEVVAQRFAAHAGASIPPGQKLSAGEIMQSVFRNKRSLLIFDNAEDATVKMLRPGGNRCAVIITTRNKGLLKNLEIPEAGHVELDSFTLNEARELLSKIIGSERVDAEPEALERIYQLVGGLPLAIRIVGGTLDDQPFTTLDEFAQLLADERERLKYLRDPDDTDLNVEASFEVSLKWLESLNETETIRTFACLGACPSEGFSLLAAQVVSEQDEFSIKGILGRLTRLSLVNMGDRPDEFALHSLLSVFARRKAEAFGLLAEVERRHTEFFLGYVLDHIEPSRDNFKALDAELNSILLTGRRLAASDEPNYTFYVALEPFLETNGYWSQALNLIDLFLEPARARNDFRALAQLTLQKGKFLQLRGKFNEARASFSESALLATQIENNYQRERTQAIVLNSMGGVYQRLGSFDQAVAAFQESQEILERLEDERGVAMVLNSLGGAYQQQGRFVDAVTAFERSKAISEAIDDERGLAMVLTSLGGAYQRQGRFTDALSTLERGKLIFERLGDERSLAMVLNSLGSTYQRQGHFDDAVAVFERSKEISEKLGSERGMAMVLNSLGSTYQRQGRFADAVASFEQSKLISEELRDERGLAMVLNSLGGAYQRQGRFDDAIAAFNRSKIFVEKSGDEHGMAMVLNSLGSAYQRQGRFEQAVAAFQQCKMILEKLGDRRGLAMVLTSLGSVYQRLEQYTEAIVVLKDSAELEREFGNLRGLAIVLNSLGGAYRKQHGKGSLHKSVSILRQSEQLEEQLGNRRGRAMVLNSLGDVYQRLHDYDKAVDVLKKSYDIETSLNNTRGRGMVLTSLGKVYQLKGDMEMAVQVFEESIAIEEELGNRRGKAMVLCAWGKALLNYDDALGAAEKLRLSFDIDESLQNVKGLRVVTPSLVRALTILRRGDEANRYIARALTISPTDDRFLDLQEQLAEHRPVSARTSVKSGTVKALRRHRTGYLYGFIATADGSEDIYFGEETVSKALLDQLVEGTKVAAEIELSARSPRARRVWPEDGQPNDA